MLVHLLVIAVVILGTKVAVVDPCVDPDTANTVDQSRS